MIGAAFYVSICTGTNGEAGTVAPACGSSQELGAVCSKALVTLPVQL